MHGTKTVVVDKQRREMRKLVKQGALKYRPLKTIFERYAAAFAQAGFTVDYQFEHLPSAEAERRQRVTDVYGTKTGHWIGIAPFSIAHGKTLPFRKMKNVIYTNIVLSFCAYNQREIIIRYPTSRVPEGSGIVSLLR